MSVDLRPMVIEDYDAVYALWSKTAGMGLHTVEDSREGIAIYLKRNPGFSFVAECDGEIVGVILCGHDGRRAMIHHTAVDEKQRGKGIGKALVDAAINTLKREGIRKAILVAFTTNDIGNSFWEHIGFTKRDDLYYWNYKLT